MEQPLKPNCISPTMQDVAAEVGVSRMTVSFALNGTGRISEETRQKVLEAAHRLGFKPNHDAQRLKGRRPQAIALFALWLDLGVGSVKVRLIQKLLKERDYYVPIHGVGLSEIGNESTQIEAVSLLRREKPRALVATTSGLHPRAIEELQHYQDEGGMLMAYDSPTPLDCDQVIFDREDNTYQATRHLLEMGHRDIGIGFHHIAHSGIVRLWGYQRALHEFGIKPRKDWCLEGKCGEDYAAGGAALARHYLALKERPTAMVIINDYSAVVFMNETQRAGLYCPRDLSVVGHDDYTMSRYNPVPLTTVTHPAQEIAESVVEYLLSRLHGDYEGTPRCITLRGELIERESTRAP